MSSEKQVRGSLYVNKGNLAYRSPGQGVFNADMAGLAGPTPGSFLATLTGTNVDLSKLSALGGWAWIQNLDSTNIVTYGSYDGATFRPMGDLLPGEGHPIRLSRYLQTGLTGTASLYTLRVYAFVVPCYVLVDAFDL